jgi:diguanylate cyclase (GGDEF)-like protein
MSSPTSEAGQATSPFTLSEIVDNVLQAIAHNLQTRYTVVMRLEGSTATVSSLLDTEGTTEPGAVYAFEDTFCAHMLRTGEPCIPDVQLAAPELRRIPAALDLNVSSYVGVPIRLNDGHIYGTLCAMDQQPRAWEGDHLKTLMLFARLLAHEFSTESQRRAAERAAQFGEGPQFTDPLTGLLTRPAFESHLRSEERRLRRYGGIYSIGVLELTHQFDADDPQAEAVHEQLLQGLAQTLMLNSRIVDCCARLDGDRFAMLFPETPAKNLPAWLRRINGALQNWNLLHPGLGAELAFSLGTADSGEADDYQAVWARATGRMLTDKMRQEVAPEASLQQVASVEIPARRETDYVERS